MKEVYVDGNLYEYSEEAGEGGFRRQHEESSQKGDEIDSNLNSIKFEISTFHVRSNPNTYLEWERKIELLFACHQYSKVNKGKICYC